jgi:hypothetical protein
MNLTRIFESILKEAEEAEEIVTLDVKEAADYIRNQVASGNYTHFCYYPGGGMRAMIEIRFSRKDKSYRFEKSNGMSFYVNPNGLESEIEEYRRSKRMRIEAMN